jgi:hypothetical protein
MLHIYTEIIPVGKETPNTRQTTTKHECVLFLSSPQMTDISVYSRSGLEQQQRNWEGSYTAVRLHNLSSTVSPLIISFPFINIRKFHFKTLNRMSNLRIFTRL